MPNGVFSGFEIEEGKFENIQESLIAVVGYPRREPGSSKKYKSIYLMCQPIDPKLPATYKELNQAEILEFLRQNKNQLRMVPGWIDSTNSEKLNKLSNILKTWMKSQVKSEGKVMLNELFTTKKSVMFKPALTENLDNKFKLENFDLIVWEYISK